MSPTDRLLYEARLSVRQALNCAYWAGFASGVFSLLAGIGAYFWMR